MRPRQRPFTVTDARDGTERTSILPVDGSAGCGGGGAAAAALGGVERGVAAESSDTVGGASRAGVPVVAGGETVCSLNGFGAALGADGEGSLRAVVGVDGLSDGARSRSPTK